MSRCPCRASHSPGRPCSQGSSWLDRQRQTPEPRGGRGGHREGSSERTWLPALDTPGRPAGHPQRPARSPGWSPVSPLRPPAAVPARRLRQNALVLQFSGRPPAWEHWRENSAMVLQTQEAFCGHWQRSCVHACTYSSTGTRPWQLAKAEAVSSRSHWARWGGGCGRRAWAGPLTPPALPAPPHGPSPPTPHGPPPRRPGTHVLGAGLGDHRLLGVGAHHLGLVHLLHVPKLDGAEGYT